MNSDQRIAELEAKVTELTNLVEQLLPAAAHQPAPDPVPSTATVVANGDTTPSTDEPGRASRRSLLKLAGAAAAGGAAAVAVHAVPAAAADSDPVKISETTSTSSGTRLSTVVAYTNSATPQVTSFVGDRSANIFTARDTPSGVLLFNPSESAYPAAVGGYSYRTVANGMYGFTSNAGYGVVGYASGTAGVGMLARGTKANLELYSDGVAPSTRTDAHTKGEVISDTNGDMWVCVVSGTPGTWRKVAGAATAGSFHAITPGRVYDSRLAEPAGSVGTIAASQNRTISVADQRNLDTGAVTTANLVPAGATAVTANVTVVNTTGSGFLACNPGGITTVSASTINWSAAGQILANGVTLTLNTSRQITVVCGGTGSTDFIIDISGYYL